MAGNQIYQSAGRMREKKVAVRSACLDDVQALLPGFSKRWYDRSPENAGTASGVSAACRSAGALRYWYISQEAGA
jgi:hypothetical protein